MSRASLVRKAGRRGRSFRQVLTQVRLGHALTLLQRGSRHFRPPSPVAATPPAALPARWEEFGLTPPIPAYLPSSSLTGCHHKSVNNY